MRRLLTHAFSNKALKEQEKILHVYVDMLIDKLASLVHRSQHPVVGSLEQLHHLQCDR